MIAPFITSNDIFIAYGLNLVAYICALGLVIAILSLFSRKHTKSTSGLESVTSSPHTKVGVLVAILSLSGVPPLFGFFSKFFIINLIAAKGSWLILIFFGVFNLFALYFYFQQLRYMTRGSERKELSGRIAANTIPTVITTFWAVAIPFLLFGGTAIEGLSIFLANMGA